MEKNYNSKRYGLKYASSGRNARKYRYNQYNNRKKNNKNILLILSLVVIILIGATLLISSINKFNPSDNVNKNVTSSKATEKIQETKPLQISYSETDKTAKIPKKIQAEYAIVINKKDNTIVASKNPHKRTYPASTTKIMTLLVAVENIKDMQDTFTMTYEITDPLYIAQASVAGFKNNEKVTMTDLLYGTILPSGADAAQGLAISVAGSEEDFVKLMNEKVKELGLKNTHFTNPTGLHNKNNYSTVYDMAVILDAALQNETCKKILSTYLYTTEKTKQNPEGIPLSSTLFNYIYGTEPETATILGGKTGYLTESGYCIASYGQANDTKNQYIAVTFDSPGKWPAFYSQIDLYKLYAQ